jgi:Tol biopolymer transport system component
MGQLSLTADGKRLAYFSTRTRKPELVLRDLATATERVLTAEPVNAVKGYPALSPDGSQLAHGTLVPGPRAVRPLVVVDLANGASRQVSDDSGGRPRQWLDERYLVIETFGSRLNSFGLVDTITGSLCKFVSSATRSLSNPRISPNGGRIAFDATPPGGSPAVIIAPIGRDKPIPESDWIVIEEAASHPFWSADGRLLYYLPTMPNTDLRSTVLARRIDAATGQPEGDAFPAIALQEMFVPTVVPGTAPHIAADEVLCVLADLRGDVWVMSL